MKERLTVSYENKPCYDIVLTNGFAELAEELKERYQDKKLCIVTDFPEPLEPLKRILPSANSKTSSS